MRFKTMDPKVTAKLLEGHKDILTPAAEKREELYQSQDCPNCGGNALTKCGSPESMFRTGEILPRYTLSCDNCDCLFDPHTGIILSLGNKAKAWEPAIPLLDGPED
jgi:hypothetical protein